MITQAVLKLKSDSIEEKKPKFQESNHRLLISLNQGAIKVDIYNGIRAIHAAFQ